MARIRTFLGHDFFFVFEVPDANYQTCDEEPGWPGSITRSDGTRRVLVRRNGTECGLLASTGCVLPLEMRPLVCRLYPYIFTAERLLGISPDCPISRSPDLPAALRAMSMDEHSAERWRQQLYAEIRQEKADAVACSGAGPS